MSQLDTLRAMDAVLLKQFDAAGLADAATFTKQGGVAVSCSVYVDRGVRFDGLNAEARVPVVTITALRAQIGAVPESGDVFVLNPNTAQAETFTVDRVDSYDESRAVCIVV